MNGIPSVFFILLKSKLSYIQKYMEAEDGKRFKW